MKRSRKCSANSTKGNSNEGKWSKNVSRWCKLRKELTVKSPIHLVSKGKKYCKWNMQIGWKEIGANHCFFAVSHFRVFIYYIYAKSVFIWTNYMALFFFTVIGGALQMNFELNGVYVCAALVIGIITLPMETKSILYFSQHENKNSIKCLPLLLLSLLISRFVLVLERCTWGLI